MMNSPLFSLVVPIFNTDPRFLEACLRSIVDQTDHGWQLVVVDDGSTRGPTRKVLDRHATVDARITIRRRDVNGGIVAATNDGLSVATGEFVGFVDHDDFLEPDALAVIREALSGEDEVDVVYTDEWVLAPDGSRKAIRKPGWSPERLRTQNYMGHLTLFRRTLLDAVGHLDPGFEGAQDYELTFRATERGRRIIHVRRPVYVWRDDPGSFSRAPGTRDTTMDSGRRAVQAHCERVGIRADVVATDRPFIYKVNRRPAEQRSLGIVLAGVPVPDGGLPRGPDTVGFERHFSGVEATVVCGPGETSGFEGGFAGLGVRVVESDRLPNVSDRLNHGATLVSGDLLMFTASFVAPPPAAELAQMSALLDDPSVGVVGGLLMDRARTVLSSGYALAGWDLRHQFRGRSLASGEDPYVATYQREVSAVSRFALMTRRDVFEAVGGFSVGHPSLSDVDFCLKVIATGRRVIVAPGAEFVCALADRVPSEWDESEIERILRRWWREMHLDPYFWARPRPRPRRRKTGQDAGRPKSVPQMR